MNLGHRPGRRLSVAEQLQQELTVLALIKETEPKIMALAQVLESDVLHAASCVLRRERQVIEMRMVGQHL